MLATPTPKRGNFLKPLSGEPKPFHFATADIEANNWTDLEMIGFYTGDSYQQYDTVADFLDDALTAKRFRNLTIFMHFGGGYDFNFILKGLTERGQSYSLITAGSRIIQIKCRLANKRAINFRDSFAILAASLDKLGRVYQVENKKLTGTIDFDRERVDKTNIVHRNYLQRDCVTLFEVLKKYFSNEKIRKAGIAATTASQAMKCFRVELKAPVRCTTAEVQNFCREGYYGGRVEIFKTSGQNINLYDVNSLFPTAMLKPMPIEYIKDCSDVGPFGFYNVEMLAPECYVPVLPVRHKGKLIFPTGVIKGTYFSEEVKAALSAGYKLIKFNKGVEFTQSDKFFKKYVEYWYNKRLENPGDNPINHTAKIMLNALYGKWGESEDKTELRTIKSTDHDKNIQIWHSPEVFELTGLVEVEKKSRRPHQLVHIAAAVTAYSRLMMLPWYQAYEEELFYTDTDSIFTTAVLPTGKGLGEMKEEKVNLECNFKLPKTYAMREQSGKVTIKAKGFPSQYLKNLTIEDFKNKSLEYQKNTFAKFRTSIIRNKEFISMVEVKRKLSSTYDKRFVFPNGDTRPWVMNNEGRIK